MATSETTNLQLVKYGAGTDNFIRTDYNGNLDKIDTFAGNTNEAIANVASYENKGNFNSDSSLQTILTTVLSGMGADSTKLIRLKCNGSFGVFGNGLVYAVDVKKYTDTYAAFLFQTVGYTITIAGSKNNNTWAWQQLAISDIIEPTISPNTAAVSDFGSNSYIKDKVLHLRAFFHAGALADQTTLCSITGYTARLRSEGVLITKTTNEAQPVYMDANSNVVSINSTRTASTAWAFLIIDVLIK